MIVPGPNARLGHATYPRVARSFLDDLHTRLGGEMFLGVHLRGNATPRSALTVDAVILPDRPRKQTDTSVGGTAEKLIAGAHAIGVVSTRGPLGMGVSGFALVAQHLLRRAGAVDAQAIALVGVDDRAVRFALERFPGLTAELAAPAI